MSGVFEEHPGCVYDAFVISSLRSSLVQNLLNARSESDTSSSLSLVTGFRPHNFSPDSASPEFA